MMRCQYCQGEIEKPEKPYFSKQAAMEGVYHWRCFIEACKNRLPVGIGTISIPNLGDDDDANPKRRLASMEE